MSALFLHEGADIEYETLRQRKHPNQYLVATWLTERKPQFRSMLLKSFVTIITDEQAFHEIKRAALTDPNLYQLRFYASNEPHRSYLDYNATKGPVFIDRNTPHWAVVNYYDRARFTTRPDDISVLTLQKQRCIPFCAPFALKLEFEWLEVVPGLQIRRVGGTSNQLKYRRLDCNGYIVESQETPETIWWSNVTKVLQMRKSQRNSLETEFRYRD